MICLKKGSFFSIIEEIQEERVTGRMVELREVDRTNFNDCTALERKSNLYVGDAVYILAQAYIYRQSSTAYAICDNDTIVGLVILLDRPEADDKYYSFTELFVADDFLGKGYGNQAVEAIIRKFRAEGLRKQVEIQVHHSNQIAKKIYEKLRFVKVGTAKWDEGFEVMRLKLRDGAEDGLQDSGL